MTVGRTRTALTAMLLVGAVLLGTAGVATGAEPAPGLGIRLLEAPSNRAQDPRAKVYVVDRVAPGARFARRFEVSNGTREVMDLRLYPAAATVEGGSFAVSDRGVPGEIAQWASITPETVRLGPGERAQAEATFVVDPKATEGEYYGGLVAERPATGSSGVRVNLRVALRVYLSVGPGGEPASDFTIDSLRGARDKTGAPVVLASVQNTGGRALDLRGTLRLSKGPGGVSAGPFPVRAGTTLGIGQTAPVSVLLDKALATGPWLASIELASGLLERRARATITFPSAPDTAGPPVPAERTPEQGLPPLVVVGATALVLTLLGALAWLLRGRLHATRP